MKSEKINIKNIFLNLIGILFVLWGIASFLHAIFISHPSEIFWFSYIGITLSGIAILVRNTKLLLAQIYILLLPNIFWMTDFFLELISGVNLLGIADYMFFDRLLISQIISFQHLVVIPFSFLALYILKTKEFNGFRLSLIEVLVVIVLSLLFGSPEVNVNCVFRQCIDFGFGLPAFIEVFLGLWAMIFISYFIISRISLFKL